MKGWCPSLHEPMATGDGMLVRVKPPSGRLTANEARLIARASATHGNGVIELTGRANLQIRGLSAASAAPFARAIVASGLACADAAAERRRTVIATPLAGADPAVNAAASAITTALETALAQDRSLEALPAKFGYLIDAGGMLPLAGVTADIGITMLEQDCEISIDGGDAVARVRLGDGVSTALRLAHAFVALATDGQRRMRALAPATVFAAAALRPSPPSVFKPPPPGARSVGFLLYSGAAGAFAAGLPFGSTTAAMLASLAALAERFGDATLRLSPWRTVLLAGVARERAEALRAELDGLDLITRPGDPRLRVSACPGQPACASATVATRSLAAVLSPDPGTHMHVAGCGKGCAHPGPAAVTLVGREGRFDLVRHGRADDAPVRRGLSQAEALAL